MKIQPAHYAYMKQAIENFSAKWVEAHRAEIIREGKARDVEMRLRWDLSYRANLSQWLSNNVYTYANDTHVDTALRSIMRELYGA